MNLMRRPSSEIPRLGMHPDLREKKTQSPALTPASPNKATAKYTNKDGSKFITVPKSTTSDISEPSPTMAQTSKANGQMSVPSTDTGVAPTVNRKKQKRRQKQAARLAAENPGVSNGVESVREVKQKMEELEARLRDHGLEEQYHQNGQFNGAEGEYYSDEEGDNYSYVPNDSPPNGYINPQSATGKKSKKKKKKSSQAESADQGGGFTNGANSHVSLPLPPLQSNLPRGPGISKEKIWNTSSQEERERIKEFWLSLGEDERKSLVKVEKDAVLKKMKEQQKHSCSCTVCGRKRTAIEEELEVLYDAYYEELEQYANHQGDGGPTPIMPPPRRFGVMSGLQPPNRLPTTFNGQQPSRGRIVEQLGDDEDEEGDEEYSEDDEDDDEYSEEEPEELQRSHATDFFNFGNSLTVQGGILTVADDLLKNDGKKFIEMMEQLAERRMAREEDAREQYANANYGHPPNGSMHPHTHTHNHPPPADDEEYDEEDEDEEDYDSQDEDYDEEEMVTEGSMTSFVHDTNFHQESMSEEQRMEEGRRMFQIFAARMFEQRVLTAYKEKVAKERQQKLLEELEEESRADSQKKAKKAKDAQKKKDKIQQKKQALAEEKARKEAEKAAEEAALRAAEEKKAEEQRLKAEEKRKKKEAQKKAEEEERMRKEAEKQRRIQEQRERQAEAERKQREAKERERKEKEEQRQKEREARESKEKEARERKEKQERERKDKEAKTKADRETKEQQKREDHTTQPSVAPQIAKRPPVPIPSNFQPHPPAVASPLVPIATPVVAKAPTPIKLRTDSQKESSNGSVPQTPQTGGISQTISPVPSTPLQGSPGPIGPPGKAQQPQPFLYQPQATSPMHAALKGPPGMPPSPFGLPHMGFQPGMPMVPPGYGGRMHHDPMFPQPMGGQYRPPNSIPIHPGHQIPQGRGFPIPHPPPGFSQSPIGSAGGSFGSQQESIPMQSHSRHHSGSFEKPFEGLTSLLPTQPIARPAPIGRPSSVVHGHRHGDSGKNEVDDLSNHLGSSALLDDSDEPITSASGVRRMSGVPVSSTRQTFPPAPFGMDHSTFGSPITGGGYGYFNPANPFGAPAAPGSNYMGAGFFNTTNGPFGAVGGSSALRPSQPHGRSVTIRLMLCRACKNLEGSSPDGYTDVNSVIDFLGSSGEGPVSEKEILDICETEGNPLNGGGSFDIRKDSNNRYSIRHENDLPPPRPIGAPGDIGSPIVGSGGLSRFAGPPGF